MTLDSIYTQHPQTCRETLAGALERCAGRALLGRGDFANRLSRFLTSGAEAPEVCAGLTGEDANLLAMTFERMAERMSDPGSEMQSLYADLAAVMLGRAISAAREQMDLESLTRL